MLDGCTIYRLLLVLTQRDVLYQKKYSYCIYKYQCLRLTGVMGHYMLQLDWRHHENIHAEFKNENSAVFRRFLKKCEKRLLDFVVSVRPTASSKSAPTGGIFREI